MVHKGDIAGVKKEYFSSEYRVTRIQKFRSGYDFVDTMIAGFNFLKSFC